MPTEGPVPGCLGRSLSRHSLSVLRVWDCFLSPVDGVGVGVRGEWLLAHPDNSVHVHVPIKSGMGGIVAVAAGLPVPLFFAGKRAWLGRHSLFVMRTWPCLLCSVSGARA